MSLGEYYDLTATGPTAPVPRDPVTHQLIGLDNPHNYKAYYAHTFINPASGVPATKNRIWYQIDLAKLVRDFPELQEEYVSDRLTLRPVTDPNGQPDDDENPWDKILADLSQAALEIKPLVKPTAYDLVLEIVYHKQELAKYRQKHAQVLAERDAIFTANQSVLKQMAAKLVAKGSSRGDQRDDQQFLLDFNTAKRQAIDQVIAASEKLLANLLDIWSGCGYQPVDFGRHPDLSDSDDSETIKALGLPEVITKEHVQEAKARLAAQKAEATAAQHQHIQEAASKPKPAQLLKLNQALAQGLVQPIPQDLLNHLVIGWYSDCLYEDIVGELQELQELKWHDKSSRMLAIMQKYSNLIMDLQKKITSDG